MWLLVNSTDDAVKFKVLELFNIDDFTFKELTDLLYLSEYIIMVMRHLKVLKSWTPLHLDHNHHHHDQDDPGDDPALL